ncbi:hypothetical protein [Nodularia sp. UHCC 0506]|uniref:hypothetical protein n=1 Tax=Nodularia sp. UHCC 0506 TaxID=3110243 RepID=UPI002B21E34C|nr:hypothetical protein [Nodularia sp. UHCC 0506]MEA5513712.1 hypothetical protein [Nodularia sp. UHCC 0506]
MTVMIFFMSVYWLVPKIVDMTVSVNATTFDELNGDSSKSLTIDQNSQGMYIPPNNGGPDSQHGSGTR